VLLDDLCCNFQQEYKTTLITFPPSTRITEPNLSLKHQLHCRQSGIPLHFITLSATWKQNAHLPYFHSWSHISIQLIPSYGILPINLYTFSSSDTW